MLTLYYYYPACSQVTHICLEESGLAYDPQLVDIKDPAKAADYKKINPKGTAPALAVDGQLLTENVAIISYIADLAPDAGILPQDKLERAQCMSLLAWSASTAHINFRRSVRPERFSDDPAGFESIKAHGRLAFWRNLEELDQRFQKQDWMMGKAFSAADGYALKFYDWGRISKQPIDELKALTAFKGRMIARPAVRRVLEREGCPLVAAA
jgi:glutathione S-transferase